MQEFELTLDRVCATADADGIELTGLAYFNEDDARWTLKLPSTLDDGSRLVLLREQWEEMDVRSQAFDDALGIVRNEAMEIIAFPDWLSSQLVLDGLPISHFVLKVEAEAHEAYENYGGPNHSNQLEDETEEWYDETAGKSG